MFGWGFVTKDSVEALKEPPMQGDRTSTLRVLTERAMHMAGFLEDGSTALGADKPAHVQGAHDGKGVPVPNLERGCAKRHRSLPGLEHAGVDAGVAGVARKNPRPEAGRVRRAEYA